MKKSIIALLLITILSLSFILKNNDLPINIILVGTYHPYQEKDTKILPNIADSLASKSDFLDSVYLFSTGKEFLKILKTVSEKNKIGNLAIMGHSGYQGFFVKKEAGFYRNDYPMEKIDPKIKVSENAAFISDLICLIKNKEIRFSKKSIIILLGCNTAYRDKNIAKDLAIASNKTVIGSSQKMDLYNVKNRGQDVLGEGIGSFVIYYFKNKKLETFTIDTKSITVNELILIAEKF